VKERLFWLDALADNQICAEWSEAHPFIAKAQIGGSVRVLRDDAAGNQQ
jgi:hypothetical protein